MKVDTDCVEISDPQSPKGRGFEPHATGFENHTAASRKGNGPRPFLGHSGPTADHSGIDRGQFSARSVKQGPVG